ncbi:unnamed protein product, partial [Ceratitis capitata]
ASPIFEIGHCGEAITHFGNACAYVETCATCHLQHFLTPCGDGVGMWQQHKRVGAVTGSPAKNSSRRRLSGMELIITGVDGNTTCVSVRAATARECMHA